MLAFQGAEHIVMNLQVGSDLVERPLFLEGFEDGFGFEIGWMSFSYDTLRLTCFGRFPCLNALDHYTQSGRMFMLRQMSQHLSGDDSSL